MIDEHLQIVQKMTKSLASFEKGHARELDESAQTIELLNTIIDELKAEKENIESENQQLKSEIQKLKLEIQILKSKPNITHITNNFNGSVGQAINNVD